MGVPGGDCGAEMSPSSPGVPGGEPEPAHLQQQRLGAVSDPRLWPARHPIASLMWCCRSWGPGVLWEGALVLACTVPSCPQGQRRAVLVYQLEQRTAEPGPPRSVPIPGASLGTSPSFCHAGWLGCRRLSCWGPCVAPPVPGGSAGLGGSAGPYPPVEAVPWGCVCLGRRGAGTQGPARSPSSQC